MKKRRPWVRLGWNAPEALAAALGVILISLVIVVVVRLGSETDHRGMSNLFHSSPAGPAQEEAGRRMQTLQEELVLTQGMLSPRPLSHLAEFSRRSPFHRVKDLTGPPSGPWPPGKKKTEVTRTAWEPSDFELVLHAIGVSGKRERAAVIEIRPRDGEGARIGCFALQEEVISSYRVTRINAKEEKVQLEDPAGGYRYDLGPCQRLFFGGLIIGDVPRAYLEVGDSKEQSSGFFRVNDPLASGYYLAAIDPETKKVILKNEKTGIALTLSLGPERMHASFL